MSDFAIQGDGFVMTDTEGVYVFNFLSEVQRLAGKKLGKKLIPAARIIAPKYFADKKPCVISARMWFDGYLRFHKDNSVNVRAAMEKSFAELAEKDKGLEANEL